MLKLLIKQQPEKAQKSCQTDMTIDELSRITSENTKESSLNQLDDSNVLNPELAAVKNLRFQKEEIVKKKNSKIEVLEKKLSVLNNTVRRLTVRDEMLQDNNVDK